MTEEVAVVSFQMWVLKSLLNTTIIAGRKRRACSNKPPDISGIGGRQEKGMPSLSGACVCLGSVQEKQRIGKVTI